MISSHGAGQRSTMGKAAMSKTGLFFAMFLAFSAIADDARAAGGNYRPERVGTWWSEARASEEIANGRRIEWNDTNNLFRLLFFPEQESLYDFDTATPLSGVKAENGKIEIAAKYSMSRPNSLKWIGRERSSVAFDIDVTVTKPALKGADFYASEYRIAFGLFQETMPKDGIVRSFDVQLFGPDGACISTRRIWLHKTGWNTVESAPPISDTLWRRSRGRIQVKRIRLTQTGGQPGEFYLDNMMLFIGMKFGWNMESKDIGRPVSTLEKIAALPTRPATAEEKAAFDKIYAKLTPSRPSLKAPYPNVMDFYRYVYKKWNVRVVGDFANGVNPIYFYVWNRTPVQELCDVLRRMCVEYSRVTDPAAKRELRKMIGDLVRLVVTFDGTPSQWYHGRGFAEAVCYARDALANDGLLDRVADQMLRQYEVYEKIYGLLPFEKDLSWDCDFIHTGSDSLLRAIIVRGATPAAARDMRQLPAWMDEKMLAYHGSTIHGLKPDGCWFHHWGNKFDNYGWGGAWPHAVEFVYHVSHTPFQMKKETHERMIHAARVRFNILTPDGYLGAADNSAKSSNANRFDALARAGTPDGRDEIHTEIAGYHMYFAKPDDPSYKDFAARGIAPAKTPAVNCTLPYGAINVHRRDKWVLYTHANAKDIYHNEYALQGLLFYQLCGFSLFEPGYINSMLIKPGQVGYRDNGNLSPGYNPSRAPGVTSLAVNYEQACFPSRYQQGSSAFAGGGVSMQNGNGLFETEFDGRNFDRTFGYGADKAYSQTPAKSFRFKKSFFYFGDDVVCLASGIGSDEPADVQTGLFQERMQSPERTITGPGGRKLNRAVFNVTLSSDKINWMIDSAGLTGVYLPKGQTFTLFKGSQTFGPTTGNMIAAWLEHGKAPKDAGYEYVLKIHPTVETMEKLAREMLSATPPYQILRRNAKTHIVRSTRHQTTGYIVFDKSESLPDSEIVARVDTPCTLMVRTDGRNGLQFAIADPNRFAEPHNIKVTLKGLWKLKTTVAVEGVDAPKVDATANDATKTTTITVRCANGLATEGLLEREQHNAAVASIVTPRSH